MDELEIIRHRQIDGLSLFLDTVEYRSSHFHNEWELIWVWTGSMNLVCEQQSYEISQGDLMLINPHAPHEMHSVGSPCTFLCVQLSMTRFPEASDLAVDSPQVQQFLSEKEAEQVRTWLLQAAYAYFRHAAFFELECVGYAGLVLHKLVSNMPTRTVSWEEEQNRTRRNARLIRLQQFVDAHYMHKIRLSDFAEAEGCSMSYLSHFVKSALNQTFQEYVSSVRYNCACKLIAAGGMNMLDVCMESGFSDYRYFVKTFRKMCGMTPEEYSRVRGVLPQDAAVRHSIHSLERFYNFDKSMELLQSLKNQILVSTDNLFETAN